MASLVTAPVEYVANHVTGTLGFMVGSMVGATLGYFLFIFSQSQEVKNPERVPELTNSKGELKQGLARRLLGEMPIWIKNPDYKRVDWINRLVLEMWPSLNEAITAEVKSQAAPMIAKYKPAALESIEFDELSLGTLPPTITGVKVYDTPDSAMIIEPVIKWVGNPNILVAAKAKAVGVKATVQLIDLSVKAVVRITLKPLVDVFPCFTRITISLMQKPQVDFGLKVVGGDVMAIPGLYNYVQETIQNVVSDMMLWPKAYEVYNAGDVTKPVGWLYVSNLSAKGLKNTVRFGKSDPYVKMTLGDKIATRKTSVKWNELNPSWADEEFQLVVKAPKTQVLEMMVMDKETSGSDHLMSTCKIGIKDLTEEPKQVTLGLVKTSVEAIPQTGDTPDGPAQKFLGFLTATLSYKQFSAGEQLEGFEDEEEDIPETLPVGGGILKVTMISGDALEVKGGKTGNPYVKVRFRNEERKTKVQKKTIECTFEDDGPFTFLVEESPKDETVHIQVWSKNSGPLAFLNQKDPIGYVDIPLNDAVFNKRLTDTYGLMDSKNGSVKIDIQWREKVEAKVEAQSGSNLETNSQQPAAS